MKLCKIPKNNKMKNNSILFYTFFFCFMFGPGDCIGRYASIKSPICY